MRYLATLAAIAFSGPVQAQSAQDLAAIDAAVAAFAGSEIGQPGGAAQPVDRRLRLRRCAAELALDWHGTRRDAVTVACPLPGGWRIFVPVLRGAASAGYAPLVARGDAVSIVVRDQDFAVSQPGEALDSGAADEWIRVRPLGAKAEPLRARVLRPGAVGIDLP